MGAVHSIHLLAAIAQRLNREAGAPPIPSLFCFTDPERTPDPCTIAKRLPRGATLVYRHFGAAERVRVARRLAAVCGARGIKLLIAADPELALRVGAAGVHWPQSRLPAQRTNTGLTTVSAHSLESARRAAAFGADACVLAPVFPTQSLSGHRPLGLFRASQIARSSGVPMIALGGVNLDTAHSLAGRGFAGLAAVDAFVRA